MRTRTVSVTLDQYVLGFRTFEVVVVAKMAQPKLPNRLCDTLGELCSGPTDSDAWLDDRGRSIRNGPVTSGGATNVEESESGCEDSDSGEDSASSTSTLEPWKPCKGRQRRSISPTHRPPRRGTAAVVKERDRMSGKSTVVDDKSLSDSPMMCSGVEPAQAKGPFPGFSWQDWHGFTAGIGKINLTVKGVKFAEYHDEGNEQPGDETRRKLTHEAYQMELGVNLKPKKRSLTWIQTPVNRLGKLALKKAAVFESIPAPDNRGMDPLDRILFPATEVPGQTALLTIIGRAAAQAEAGGAHSDGVKVAALKCALLALSDWRFEVMREQLDMIEAMPEPWSLGLRVREDRRINAVLRKRAEKSYSNMAPEDFLRHVRDMEEVRIFGWRFGTNFLCE